MNVRIEADTIARVAKVWFYDQHPDGTVVYALDTAQNTITPRTIANGETVGDPSLTLPVDWLSALADAASEYATPSAAQAAHLADAISVRDRLLTLVEKH